MNGLTTSPTTQKTYAYLGDSPTEHIFVPHNPAEAVKKLLEAWAIKPSSILRVLPYKALHCTIRIPAEAMTVILFIICFVIQFTLI